MAGFDDLDLKIGLEAGKASVESGERWGEGEAYVEVFGVDVVVRGESEVFFGCCDAL